MPAPPVSVYTGPPAEAWTSVQDFAGGANPVYNGLARSRQKSYTYTVTSVSKAGSAVATITAHGLQNDNPVVISGATGDWAGLNGTRAVTVTGADTFTVAVDTSGYSGDFDGTITTTAPRTNAACWQVTKSYWDAAGNIRIANCEGSVGDDKVWADRASLAFA